MTIPKFDIAFWTYDRTRALADESVEFDGVDATFRRARIVTEMFESIIAGHAFVVSEMGLTSFEQGLSKRHMTCADIFAPHLLET